MKADHWSAAENRTLRHHWVMGEPIRLWARELPGRGLRAIYCHARYRLGLAPLGSYRRHAHVVAWTRIEAALRQLGTATVQMLAAATYLSRSTVLATLNALDGVACHIAWRASGRRGAATCLWTLGARP